MTVRAVALGIALLALRSSSALANPVSCEKLIVQQVPKTRHVQITWADMCGGELEMRRFERDGEVLNPDWIPYSGFTTNMGSGLDTMDCIQTCDCSVDLGGHEYVLEVGYSDIPPMNFERSVTVVKDLPTPEEPTAQEETGVGDAGFEAPWDIPDPVGIQGLDCVGVCQRPSGAEAAAGTSGDDAVPGEGTTLGGSAGDGDSGGCSVAGQARLSGLVLMIGAGLLLGIRRRTRR